MNSALESHFLQLTQVLERYRAYWQLLPFNQFNFPWQNEALITRLSVLDLDQVRYFDQDVRAAAEFFSDIFPELNSLFKLPINATKELPSLPFWLENGVGGRKVAQINALCHSWQETHLPILEWCAGKGHLGRILAYRFNVPVTSVEWQQELCDDGQLLADKYQLPQHFVCQDVLNDPSASYLKMHQHVVALHACGQLHINLLQQAVKVGSKALHVVPCCYHLIPTPYYQPLSTRASSHNLNLSKNDLKLVVQGQATAGNRIEKLRETEVLWRLAYDELRANITGDRAYKPLSSVNKKWFTGSFIEFAKWALQEHKLELPSFVNEAALFEKAQARYVLVQKIELVRHLFRRPLELWLALDKAFFLMQNGYEANVSQFCDESITPRNVLLTAHKRS